MSRLVVGPFNRVEGDLEVRLEIGDGIVNEARVVAPLYRGFEQMLQGKDPRDALVISPRICGICSVSQSVAAAGALAEAQSLSPPSNGRLVTNIVHAIENIADHLTHFYMFFMPDFAREIYKDEQWFADTANRFAAINGSAAKDILPPRAELMNIVGLLAGKWPHTLSFQSGGVTRVVARHEIQRLLLLVSGFRQFLQRTVFGCDLEEFSDLSSCNLIYAWADNLPSDHSDLLRFLYISRNLELQKLGRATDHFLSYGAYHENDGHLFSRGLRDTQGSLRLNTGLITEDISNAWMLERDKPRHPFDGVTSPDPEMSQGYTWCKAPRIETRPAEVGALARQVVDRHPLALDMVSENGGNVEARIISRFLEMALIVPAMENWIRAIQPDDIFINHAEIPDDCEGAGLVEAARGALGHWLRVSGGKIGNYQIIAPTTWNFSPRDATGQPGPLEVALVNAPVRKGETDPVAVQHIVRSFDPCMVCTVH